MAVSGFWGVGWRAAATWKGDILATEEKPLEKACACSELASIRASIYLLPFSPRGTQSGSQYQTHKHLRCVCSGPSLFTGLASMDVTNCGLKNYFKHSHAQPLVTSHQSDKPTCETWSNYICLRWFACANVQYLHTFLPFYIFFLMGHDHLQNLLSTWGSGTEPLWIRRAYCAALSPPSSPLPQ